MRKFFSDFSPTGKIILLLIFLGFLSTIFHFIREMVYPPPPELPPTCERSVERIVMGCMKPLNSRGHDMECMDKGKAMLEICKGSGSERINLPN